MDRGGPDSLIDHGERSLLTALVKVNVVDWITARSFNSAVTVTCIFDSDSIADIHSKSPSSSWFLLKTVLGKAHEDDAPAQSIKR